MAVKGFAMNERSQLNRVAIQPQVYIDSTPRFGFTQYAEKLNGRLAMLGFVALVVVEVLTGQGLLGWLNL